MSVNNCVVGYHTPDPPVFILPQVEKGTAYYEGGSYIPCLVHTFTDADQIRSALAWVDRSLTDPTFLKVLAVDDKLREPNNCRLVVVSEDSRSTFEGWALAHKAQLVTTYGMYDHLSIDLAHHLRSIINMIADLGRPMGP
ncbi:PREDICTED: uncharacterized protein LOC101314626 [Fragaria vesca subsp. vesca]|uniref:uncharacterized protein LOC101314626 n=1 Tax=Fragaria vesca subsp. vesca TaxID=101020 RepID=UPI0002C35D64|nr:PREDICTED: uncharacterized protein LOC101314626 [Fragaria vesca subsp. vesca]